MTVFQTHHSLTKQTLPDDTQIAVIDVGNFFQMLSLVESLPKSNEDSRHDKDWQYTSYETLENTRDALYQSKVNPEISRQVEKMSKDMMQNINFSHFQDARRRRQYNDNTGEISVNRALNGNDKYYFNYTRSAKKKVIRLGIDLSISSDNKESTFIRLASLGIVTTNILSRIGYDTEVYITRTAEDMHPDKYIQSGIKIKVKDARHPIDVNRLACVGISGLLRYYSFKISRYCFDSEVHYGQGKPSEPLKEIIDLYGIDEIIGIHWTEKKQIDFINHIIKQR